MSCLFNLSGSLAHILASLLDFSDAFEEYHVAIHHFNLFLCESLFSFKLMLYHMDLLDGMALVLNQYGSYT